MAEMAYVCLYISYLQSLSPFTDAERGRIVIAMLNYAATGEVPQFEGNERFIWPSLQAQIDRDIETYLAKCARNKANGAKGGRPPKNPAVIPETERFAEKPEKPKEKETEKEKEMEKEMDNIVADNPSTRSYFSPPSVDEVKAYCAEKGYALDADRFVDYYTSNGWLVGKNPMKDWKAACRFWASKDKAEKHGDRESGIDRLARIYKEEFGE